jgi:hypothetical protein
MRCRSNLHAADHERREVTLVDGKPSNSLNERDVCDKSRVRLPMQMHTLDEDFRNPAMHGII